MTVCVRGLEGPRALGSSACAVITMFRPFRLLSILISGAIRNRFSPSASRPLTLRTPAAMAMRLDMKLLSPRMLTIREFMVSSSAGFILSDSR